MNIIVLNEHRVFLNLGQFFEFAQSIVDIGFLFHCYTLFFIKEPNLNEGRLANNVLLDRYTNFCSIIVCFVPQFVAVGKLLIHSWPFVRSKFYLGTSPRFSASWITVFLHAEVAFSSFLPRWTFWVALFQFFEYLEVGFKVNFPLVKFLGPGKSPNSCMIFWKLSTIGTRFFLECILNITVNWSDEGRWDKRFWG